MQLDHGIDSQALPISMLIEFRGFTAGDVSWHRIRSPLIVGVYPHRFYQSFTTLYPKRPIPSPHGQTTSKSHIPVGVSGPYVVHPFRSDQRGRTIMKYLVPKVFHGFLCHHSDWCSAVATLWSTSQCMSMPIFSILFYIYNISIYNVLYLVLSEDQVL
jgi:hypothetical protein